MKNVKKFLNCLLVSLFIFSIGTVITKANWSTGYFSFYFYGAEGEVYSYSESQKKDNASSSYVYYSDGDYSFTACVVGYDNGIVEDIELPQRTYNPGESGYLINYINENGLSEGCLRGEADTDVQYSVIGDWSIDTY